MIYDNKKNIGILVSGIALITVALLGLGGYLYLQERYIESVFLEQNITLKLVTHNIKLNLDEQKRKVRTLANNPEIISFIQGEKTKKDLEDWMQKNFATTSVILFSSDKKPIFTSKNNEALFVNNEAIDISLQRSLLLNDEDFSDFIADQATKLYASYITAPIIVEKKYIGSIAIELNTSGITKIVTENPHLGNTGEIIISKKIKNIPTVILPTRFNANAAFNETLATESDYKKTFDDVTNGKRGTTIVNDDKNKKSLVAWQYFPYTQWGATIKIAYKEIIQPFLKLKIICFLLILFALLAALYCFYAAWNNARKNYSLQEILSASASRAIYVLFVINTFLLVSTTAHFILKKRFKDTQNSISFAINLKDFAQQIDSNVTRAEIIANSIAFDLSKNQTLNASNIVPRLKSDLQGNNEIDSIIFVHKNGQSWNALSLDKTDSGINEAKSDAQELNWLERALTFGNDWTYPTTNTVLEPVYYAKYYDVQDSEQKKPVGIIGVVHKKSTLLKNVNTERGQYFLALPDKKIVAYKNSEVVSTEIPKNRSTISFEKIPHLGWYLGGIAAKKYDYFTISFIMFMLSIILILASLCIAFYSFVTYREDKHTRALLYAFVTVLLVTCINILLIFRFF